jgi:hypothetical protein
MKHEAPSGNAWEYDRDDPVLLPEYGLSEGVEHRSAEELFDLRRGLGTGGELGGCVGDSHNVSLARHRSSVETGSRHSQFFNEFP